MAYISQDTVLYRPLGDLAPEAVALCRYGDIMAALVDVTPTVQVQRDAVIGSRWIHQAARGNALIQMSWTVARAFETPAAARAWGLDMQELLIMHPEGTVTWLTAWYAGQAQRVREYHATVDAARPHPMTSEQWYGHGAWCALDVTLTLSGDID